MVRTLARALPLVALVAIQALAPQPATAQLGGLVKKAAKKAVENAIPFTPKEAPEFNDRVLEITADRLDRLMKGFEAEAANAKSASKEFDAALKRRDEDQKAYDKAMEAFNKESQKWNVCAEDFRKKEAEASAANEAKIEKTLAEMDDEELEKHLEDLAARGEELTKELQAGRNSPELQKKWEQYQLELQAVMVEQQRRAMLIMSGAMKEARRERTEDPRLIEACGKRPEPPVSPDQSSAGPETILRQKGIEASGLTADQYSIMRERVIYWSEKDGRPEGMGYTQDEIDLLAGRADDVNGTIERMKKAKVPL